MTCVPSLYRSQPMLYRTRHGSEHHELGDLVARVVAQPAADLLAGAVADSHRIVVAEVAGHLRCTGGTVDAKHGLHTAGQHCGARAGDLT